VGKCRGVLGEEIGTGLAEIGARFAEGEDVGFFVSVVVT
jgi:hypothetical protein